MEERSSVSYTLKLTISGDGFHRLQYLTKATGTNFKDLFLAGLGVLDWIVEQLDNDCMILVVRKSDDDIQEEVKMDKMKDWLARYFPDISFK